MKNNKENPGSYKYLTRYILIGFGTGACVGATASIFLNHSLGFGLSIGTSLGMIVGIVIGTVLDESAKNKE